MLKSIQPLLASGNALRYTHMTAFILLLVCLCAEEELVAAQWILCYCHKQLPYDRNWWSRAERQNGELSISIPEIKNQIEMLNGVLLEYIQQLLRATEWIK